MQSKTQDGFQKQSKSSMKILRTASELNDAQPATLQTQELETKSNGLGKDRSNCSSPGKSTNPISVIGKDFCTKLSKLAWNTVVGNL